MILQVPRFLFQNFCLLSVIAGVAAADSPANLKPMMAVPDAVVLKDDFSRSHALQKGVWQTRQGTRWSIEDGVLRGQQSSPEYQAKKKDHFAYGFGVAGPKKGFVELDNLTIWNVKEENQPGWSKRMSKFPHYTPVRIKEPKNR
jgi:hypothetical protein